jgi:hypothetical protein
MKLIDMLASVNEQLHSADAPRFYYTKGLLAGITASNKKDK